MVNTFESSPRRNLLTAAILVMATASLPNHAHADAVTDWNLTADQTAATVGPAPFGNRIMAITHIAIHDALNAIRPRNQSYNPQPRAAAGASAEAAVASAAFNTLRYTVPAQAAALEVIYENRIVELPACPPRYPDCIEDGIAVGAAAAAEIIAMRSADGSATPHLPYTLPPGPGVYQPTPPALAAPLFAGWANMLPFAMYRGSQFRSPPVAAMNLRSQAYARDLNEVKQVGSSVVRAANPDSEPSQIARFWPSAGGMQNAVTRLIASGRGLDMWEHARLFALLNIAMSDGAVSVFETKYTYNFWRPVTAIRAADTDGNPATAPDAAWLSYVPTPPYPDYTCGLTTIVGAANEILRRFFNTDRVPYTFTAGGVTRSFDRLSQADADAVNARVYGGMHFRTGCAKGIQQGAAVARFVYERQLQCGHGHGHGHGHGWWGGHCGHGGHGGH